MVKYTSYLRRYAPTATAETTANYLLPWVKTEQTIGGTPPKGYTLQDTVRTKVQGGGENCVHGGISFTRDGCACHHIQWYASRLQKVCWRCRIRGFRLFLKAVRCQIWCFFTRLSAKKQPVGEKVQPCSYNLYFTNVFKLGCSGQRLPDNNRW